jgi:hypothetical protein
MVVPHFEEADQYAFIERITITIKPVICNMINLEFEGFKFQRLCHISA